MRSFADQIQRALRGGVGGLAVEGQLIGKFSQRLHLSLFRLRQGNLSGIVGFHPGGCHRLLLERVAFFSQGCGDLSVCRSGAADGIFLPRLDHVVAGRLHPAQVGDGGNLFARLCLGAGDGQRLAVVAVFKAEGVFPHRKLGIDAKAAVYAAAFHLLTVAAKRAVRVGGTGDIIVGCCGGNIFRRVCQLEGVLGVQGKAGVQHLLAVGVFTGGSLHRKPACTCHDRHSQRQCQTQQTHPAFVHKPFLLGYIRLPLAILSSFKGKNIIAHPCDKIHRTV